MLLKGRGFVKTTRFKEPKYLGDPINIVRIFNEKEADEMVILDIEASRTKSEPQYDLIGEIAAEAFMPLSYGGGIASLDAIRRVLRLGIEKVSINSAYIENRNLIKEAAHEFGSSTIAVSIDVKRNFLGKYVTVSSVKNGGGRNPVQEAIEAEQAGAGEILIQSVDRDGTMAGYDLNLVKKVSSSVSIPVIAIGGAANKEDLARVIHEGGASAAAAGALFVYQGPHRAVLISYSRPTESQVYQQR